MNYYSGLPLREMTALEPKVLCPGHGIHIVGQQRVKQALEDTATFLESIFDQTITLMNQGTQVGDILSLLLFGFKWQ